ncbi:hypothetical protein [Merismopedia glauca]|uniref:Leucine rich repeat variant n=1 Tax=Merismopedia glauca CCAP 1448/3 TaxID=1296344 RepID=A0A2T1C9W3_9CYAN|nr:hypothetical protein [Merismopedia glauca]PSB05029.1 hypothetical protein C7B64_01320 [Merismopedia glauca CCAP 1448/3]
MLNKLTIASDLTTSADILAQIAEDPDNEDDSLIKAVADNPNTPGSVLATLWKNRDEWGKKYKSCEIWHFLDIAIARHPNTPVSLIAELFADNYARGNLFVREALAQNPNTPAQILVKLAQEEHYSVRKGVAKNPNTPRNILESWASESILIECYLQKNPQLQADIKAAQSLDTEVDRLLELAQSPFSFIRMLVGGNSSTPAIALQTLSRDRKSIVRLFVEQNPQFQIDIQAAESLDPNIHRLVELSGSPYPFLRKAVAKNHPTLLPVLQQLISVLTQILR